MNLDSNNDCSYNKSCFERLPTDLWILICNEWINDLLSIIRFDSAASPSIRKNFLELLHHDGFYISQQKIDCWYHTSYVKFLKWWGKHLIKLPKVFIQLHLIDQFLELVGDKIFDKINCIELYEDSSQVPQREHLIDLLHRFKPGTKLSFDSWRSISNEDGDILMSLPNVQFISLNARIPKLSYHVFLNYGKYLEGLKLYSVDFKYDNY
jgi:hypothetical protein